MDGHNVPWFDDLPKDTRCAALSWLLRLFQRARAARGRVEKQHFAILVGQARRLATNPPTSAWGRSMHARRGGLAVQRKYRQEGRHPTARALAAKAAKKGRLATAPNPLPSTPPKTVNSGH
jgi:hypothetical protein